MRAILLLGAAVRADGPSPALRRRAEHAAGLIHAGAADMIVACGGAGVVGGSEAEAAAGVLRKAGVAKAAIRLETRSASTWENLLFARPILAEIGAQERIIVTDAFHLPRARLAAARLGIPARGSAPPPSGEARAAYLRALLREGPALVAYALRPLPR